MNVVERRKAPAAGHSTVMANTTDCIQRLKEVAIVSDSPTMVASGDSEAYCTAPATEIHDPVSTCASTSSITFTMKSARNSSLEERIEQSKSHWSELSEFDSDGEVAEKSNVQVFRALQMDPRWGDFFLSFTEEEGRTLVVGEKFAEGGQAELYHVLDVKWYNEVNNKSDKIWGENYVLKVFKKGTCLRHLQTRWPLGMLKALEDKTNIDSDFGNSESFTYKHFGIDQTGLLLEDGRFAFLMPKRDEDLRSLIDRNMKMRNTQYHGPFSEDVATTIMYDVALAMEYLHTYNIVHRDLKASNILVINYKDKRGIGYYVADFETSIGVIGTGFFRAPEILQACKDKTIRQKEKLFTKEADVYSYGMLCYEILTGKFPFEGHLFSNYDLVLNGQYPEVPEFVDDWARRLLNRCWHPNPAARPSFGDILNLIIVNSPEILVDYRERCKACYALSKINSLLLHTNF